MFYEYVDMNGIKFKIHWSFLLLGILMIVFGKFQVFLFSLVCVVLHEMGHSLVGRHLGYKLNIITLLPYGAMLSGNNMPFNYDDEIKIAIAGPIVNVFLIVVSVALWWVFPVLYNFSYDFVWTNIYTLCFNILPVYPLDGGRIMLATLSKKMSRKKANKITKIFGFFITGLVFLLFFISFFFGLNYMLGINALFLLIGLLDEQPNAYYEKLSAFDVFRFSSTKKKVARLNSEDYVFDAYKKVVEENASEIAIRENDKIINKIPKKQILSKVLVLPLDTKLKDI